MAAWLAALSSLLHAPPVQAVESDESAEDGAENTETREPEDSDAAKRAERDRGLKGVFALTVNTTLAGYSLLSFDLSVPQTDFQGVPVRDANGNQVYFDTTGTLTNTAWGPSTNSVSIELAYGISKGALLGGLLELGGSTFKTSVTQINDEVSLARFLVGPKYEIVFDTESKLRPFALAVAGFTWAPQQTSDRSVSLTGFEFFLGSGLHWQLAPSFSIDPAVRVGGGIGWGNVNLPLSGNASAHGTLLSAALLLGTTGWML